MSAYTYDYVPCDSVERDVAALAGEDYANLGAVDLALIRNALGRRLRGWAWAAWRWPETTLTERRRYRADYDAATAYAAPTTSAVAEVYYPPTGQYYQALRATTGNAPATLSGTTYTTNEAYWAEVGGPWSPADWLDATDYAVGDTVRNPADGEPYACHTAHTSSSTLDATKFGLLATFDPLIARDQSWEDNEIADYLGAFLDDPRTTACPRRLSYAVDGAGAHLLPAPRGGSVPAEVWLTFRPPCPELRGADYSASATYTADVSTVHFSGSTADLAGDFWTCISTTTAGQSPETHPAKWSRQAIPAWLRGPLAQMAYADWLRADGQTEKATYELQNAQDELFHTYQRLGAQQGQYLRWRHTA